MTPRSQDGKVPLSIFSNLSRSPDLKSLHPFGCPVYVLENTLKQVQTLGKWENRSRIGMYLGHSPTHARSVHLVLSIRTGLVSPQFHVRFDNFFESTSWVKFMPRSEWKFKARILEEKASSTPDLDRITMTRMLRPNSNNNSSSPIDQGGVLVQNNMDDEQQTMGDQAGGEVYANYHENEEEIAISTNNSSTNQLNNQIADQRPNSSYDTMNREAETSQMDEYQTRSGRRVIRPQ